MCFYAKLVLPSSRYLGSEEGPNSLDVSRYQPSFEVNLDILCAILLSEPLTTTQTKVLVVSNTPGAWENIAF